MIFLSNLGQRTSYPECLWCHSSVREGKRTCTTTIAPRQFPSKSFSIHQSPYDSTLQWLQLSLKNSQPTSCQEHYLFRRSRTDAKSAFYLRTVCPSVSGRLSLDSFSLEFDISHIFENLSKNPNLVKFGHFPWRPKVVLLLQRILNDHKIAAFERNGIRISEQSKRYKYYSKMSQCYVIRIYCLSLFFFLTYFLIHYQLPMFLPFHIPVWIIDNVIAQTALQTTSMR